MQPTLECVAGFGHLNSLWFAMDAGGLTGVVIENNGEQEAVNANDWLKPRVLVFKTTPAHPQKREDVLRCLATTAGTRAVQAVRDYNVYELALAFTSNYSWQLINGAKILPDFGELAKVYAGQWSIYLFKSEFDALEVHKKLAS